jgi:hypothetical protein
VRAASWQATAKPNSHTKTHEVEPDGARGKILHLTWGTLTVRAEKGAAEAVVAKKRGNSRRAKGRRNKTKLERGLKGSCVGA